MTTRDKIIEAFHELQGKGWFTGANQWLCQSDMVADTPDDKPYIGFTKQDNEAFTSGKFVLLSHGSPFTEDPSSNDNTYSLEAVDVLRKHGLKIEWDGSMSKRIKVLL